MLDPGKNERCIALKDAVASIVDVRREATFYELIEHLADLGRFVVYGEARLHLGAHANIIVWAGLSEALARCICDLVAEGRLCLQEVSPLRYGPAYLQMTQAVPLSLRTTAAYVPAVLHASRRPVPPTSTTVFDGTRVCAQRTVSAPASVADGPSFGVPVVPRCLLSLVGMPLRDRPQ